MRRFIFIVLIIVLLAAAAITAVTMMNRRNASAPAETSAAESEPALPPASESAPRPFEGKAAAEVVLAQRARSVAERYGSYSTDRPYENLRDLAPVVSDRLWSQFEAQMQKGRGNAQERSVVVSVGVEILEESEGTRRFRVPVQRTVFSAGGSKQTEGAIRVIFVQEGGGWKADAIQWE